MSLRFGPLTLGVAAALGAALVASNDAHACGGCFHEQNQPETTLVTGHRMAFSISPVQTVLWDQIKYAGNPAGFAWVLPVKAGAYIEASNDSWFEALDAATSTRVVPPQLNCSFPNDGFSEGGGSGSGCGCGSGAGADFGGTGGTGEGPVLPPPPVTVTHEGSIGPYETVTVHANVPDALPMWLTSHGYAIDPSITPVINAYVNEGFDFIALRLQPGLGVQQMKPVRVVSPGASPTLPLRMVAAGTGANVDLTLFVISEGRWETDKNFPNALVNVKDLTWDFNTDASNFAAVRQKMLASGDGRSWLTTYSKRGALLSTINNPTTSTPVQYSVSSGGFNNPTTIAELFALQGLMNGETSSDQCTGAFTSYAQSSLLVVDVCTGQGGGGGAGGGGGTGGGSGSCGTPGLGQIDSREFACDKLDDMAVALTGLHPRDVWLTRLEANLPRAALNLDLNLQGSQLFGEVENWLTAPTPLNPPCQLAASPVLPGNRGGPTGGSSRQRTRLALFAVTLAALGVAFARRMQRRGALVPVQSR
jgi:hypothetical protein